jgi:hypothetical protein
MPAASTQRSLPLASRCEILSKSRAIPGGLLDLDADRW